MYVVGLYLLWLLESFQIVSSQEWFPVELDSYQDGYACLIGVHHRIGQLQLVNEYLLVD